MPRHTTTLPPAPLPPPPTTTIVSTHLASPTVMPTHHHHHHHHHPAHHCPPPPSSPSSSSVLIPLPPSAEHQQQTQRYFARLSHSPVYRPKTFGWSNYKLTRLVDLPCPVGFRSRRALVLAAIFDFDTTGSGDAPAHRPRSRTASSPHARRFLAQRYRRGVYHRYPFAQDYLPSPPHAWMDRVDELREGRALAAAADDDAVALPPLVMETQRKEQQRRVEDDDEDEGEHGDYDDKEEEEGDDVDEEVRELYRMGLLYDDEHERGSGFTLDAIAHDTAATPPYTLTVRSRDHRRHGGNNNNNNSKRPHQHAHDGTTSTTTNSTDDDEALAAFLAEADYIDVCAARHLLLDVEPDGAVVAAAAGPSRKEGTGAVVVEAMRAQQRLWEAFRGDRPSDLDGVEWEVV
ncbi:hypothetical protein JDV02_001623 [Purpureocillium takamizusanense]|uniref:Uncharacterized protein n=1 Tax=Purpureocillium takamizusanense TaxID=2060973 RepID=A0A9Q8V805_9HYPO|nr:uncharacterized protein JDV02_001623 [Purpureocillium takamizusanense]UNI15051.1 hypothetical protein JDV02_001623 [Purpureocillium takamizusanense]